MHPPDSSHPLLQILWLFVLSIPVGCVAWTVTHEEIFREPREFCEKCIQQSRSILRRKFFYLFTCEYCFSHYVTAAFLFMTGYRLLLDDWRGMVLSFFGVVFVSNIYMSLYSRLRVTISVDRAEVKVREKKVEQIDQEMNGTGSPLEDGEHVGSARQ